jgi:hypothetical protein
MLVALESERGRFIFLCGHQVSDQPPASLEIQRPKEGMQRGAAKGISAWHLAGCF